MTEEDTPVNPDIRQLAERIYGEELAASVEARIQSLLRRYRGSIPAGAGGWNQTDAFLITYGDSILDGDTPPLRSLRAFLDAHLTPQINIVHILPFFPWTSDDGFSVVDYRQVNGDLGDWADIEALAGERRLCFDAVVNHVSQTSDYVQGYLRGDPAFTDFAIALPPDTDTSTVVRPRNLPLLHDFVRADGSTAWLWTTFSRDQVDLNFANPNVLIEILDVLLFYARKGAGLIRLDAIPYLWKALGTGCVHLPQTHDVVKLFRRVCDEVAPHVILLTETNVPHRENITYFGDAGDEAQMIYNFSLPPLIVWSVLSGTATHLTHWAHGIEKIGDNATYLNITATHDGIGLRPTEGILTDGERTRLTDMVIARGGRISEKRNSDGSTSPYEMNIAYFDAINDPASIDSLALQVEKFMLSQTIPMSLMGIPGIYIHSLLGTRNDYDGLERTGRARSINRKRMDTRDLHDAMQDASSLTACVHREYTRRLDARAGCAAFHPNATQRVLELDARVFAVERYDAGSGTRVIALHNVSGEHISLKLDLAGNIRDLLAGKSDLDHDSPVSMAPYQCRWLQTTQGA